MRLGLLELPPASHLPEDGVPGPLVAFDPAVLARNVARYVGVAERNLHLMEELGEQIVPLLEPLRAAFSGVQTADALDHIERATVVYDRLVKSGLNLVKALDELHRLQSFMAGGVDSRPDLSSLGEIELRAVVIRAVAALGITDLRQLTD